MFILSDGIPSAISLPVCWMRSTTYTYIRHNHTTRCTISGFWKNEENKVKTVSSLSLYLRLVYSWFFFLFLLFLLFCAHEHFYFMDLMWHIADGGRTPGKLCWQHFDGNVHIRCCWMLLRSTDIVCSREVCENFTWLKVFMRRTSNYTDRR